MRTTFDQFHEAVHGYEPFPWLSALAKQVEADPAALDRATVDVPTGLGKTSMIDLAVWLAAATGCAPGTAGRRRICFLIDRRIVVDDAFHHAAKLAEKLKEGGTSGGDDAISEVARSLAGLWDAGPDDEPLCVTRMRGGVTWDWRWLDRPDRPAVIVGTVDQLGSRLLFRGYGTSPRLAPIDAALVGTDSLFLIDEAHLCAPLLETVDRISGNDVDASGLVAPRPLVTTLSATQAGGKGRLHSISDDDWAHEVAGARLRAPKTLHLVEVDAPGKRRPGACVSALVAAVTTVADDEQSQAIGVVCNTVGRARAVFEALRSDPPEGADVLLLTGRVRPWDRERLQEQLVRLAGVGRNRASSDRVVVVATQTIEVGVNADFDALVTESASWDALVQRLGRLNRVAHHRNEPGRPAIVIHDRDTSFLYGETRENTWTFLSETVEPVTWRRGALALGEGFGASPGELRGLVQERGTTDLQRPAEHAPVLMPAQLDDWTRTTPRPNPDTPLEPFLHGPIAPRNEVSLVWRCDLGEDPDRWPAILAATPPVHAEMLSVPISAAGRWLRGLEPGDIDDALGLEPEATDGDVSTAEDEANPAGLIWRKEGEHQRFTRRSWHRQIRPDDVLVLPSALGGCDGFGWAPGSKDEVPDIADLAATEPFLRLEPKATLRQTLQLAARQSTGSANGLAATACPNAACDLEQGAPLDDLLDVIAVELGHARDDEDPTAADKVRQHLWSHLPSEVLDAIAATGLDLMAAPVDGPEGQRWIAKRSSPRGAKRFASDGGDPASTSALGVAVTLEDHQKAVEERARTMGSNLKLDARLIEAVALAASWHDVGKLDPRFQVMLHGGDTFAAEMSRADGKPLGKSGTDPSDRTAFRASFQASGLPRGFRHEVGSAAAVRDLAEASDVDVELVVHLVGAHHGNGRPLFPPVVDEGTHTIRWEDREVTIDRSATVDWTSPGRFANLNRTYGRWGLALLEAIVRLSDIGCSEEGS